MDLKRGFFEVESGTAFVSQDEQTVGGNGNDVGLLLNRVIKLQSLIRILKPNGGRGSSVKNLLHDAAFIEGENVVCPLVCGDQPLVSYFT